MAQVGCLPKIAVFSGEPRRKGDRLRGGFPWQASAGWEGEGGEKEEHIFVPPVVRVCLEFCGKPQNKGDGMRGPAI